MPRKGLWRRSGLMRCRERNGSTTFRKILNECSDNGPNEIRSPKSKTRKKSEIRNPNQTKNRVHVLHSSAFNPPLIFFNKATENQISGFGLRISDFRRGGTA